jgi:hypothetical protein
MSSSSSSSTSSYTSLRDIGIDEPSSDVQPAGVLSEKAKGKLAMPVRRRLLCSITSIADLARPLAAPTHPLDFSFQHPCTAPQRTIPHKWRWFIFVVLIISSLLLYLPETTA